jgi:hypothetical protein
VPLRFAKGSKAVSYEEEGYLEVAATTGEKKTRYGRDADKQSSIYRIIT